METAEEEMVKEREREGEGGGEEERRGEKGRILSTWEWKSG